jgi:hypothetical protein
MDRWKLKSKLQRALVHSCKLQLPLIPETLAIAGSDFWYASGWTG